MVNVFRPTPLNMVHAMADELQAHRVCLQTSKHVQNIQLLDFNNWASINKRKVVKSFDIHALRRIVAVKIVAKKNTPDNSFPLKTKQPHFCSTLIFWLKKDLREVCVWITN